jgi:hypothetical protein
MTIQPSLLVQEHAMKQTLHTSLTFTHTSVHCSVSLHSFLTRDKEKEEEEEEKEERCLPAY